MRYEMRRKDRQISGDESNKIIDKASFGVMATVDGDGIPYAVPLNFVREGDLLYFHGAMEGHKIDNLKERPDVCVTFVGNVSFPENHFTTIFESAILFGKAEEVTGEQEKIYALKRICERFIPKYVEHLSLAAPAETAAVSANSAAELKNAFDEAINKQLKATSVWKIKIETINGKQRVL
jgi:nitroimidazol reductase NimA-like FMN-containing flavoprotein (pyridoxamine 5'-phosphate oxidase superfamily)